jgi:TonB family protein
METGFRSISFSTTFSLLLHATLAVAIVQTRDVVRATGTGVEIELVSSSTVSHQLETEQAASRPAVPDKQSGPAEQTERKNQSRFSDSIVPRQDTAEQQPARMTASAPDAMNTDAGEKMLSRSTNAAVNHHSIIELLHTKISEHKHYPYMARRQRREGVARVEFVLHPNGSIDDAHVIHSSRTRSLDNAALKAVESIEPFIVARDFLQQPEAFQVDVVFDAL